MPLVRYGRPGLLGTVARTSVVAGTASMTANAVNRRTHAPEDVDDLVEKLAQLAKLHDSGALSPQEFEAAKMKLLA
jgi:Short C-terminal domain